MSQLEKEQLLKQIDLLKSVEAK